MSWIHTFNRSASSEHVQYLFMMVPEIFILVNKEWEIFIDADLDKTYMTQKKGRNVCFYWSVVLLFSRSASLLQLLNKL